MRRAWDVPPDVRTVHLGAYTPDHAPLVFDALETAEIVWWAKPPGGGISKLWDRDVHVFVDRSRLEEARALVGEILDR